MDNLFQKLKDKMVKYNPNCDFTLIDKAYDFAKNAHCDQYRASGELFIVHPLMVAHHIADMELDVISIIVAILHDVVEDTHYTHLDILQQFGEEIASLVEGMTKLDKISFTTKEEEQAENLRKLFIAMARDIRIVVIKLADRLHNMQTLKSLPEDKRREKSLETMEVYAPIAHRLGMSKIKWELEDLSLRYLDPIAYHEISENIAHKRQEREEYIKSIEMTIAEKLSELDISFHIEGRAKHFYSIYRKMYSQNISIDQIYDLLALRIIVDSVSDCYRALGLVHELFKPIPKRFKDYIAMPKNNMYQSLHNTMIGPTGAPFEVQIRTWDMHRISEVGIAAHWLYKEDFVSADDHGKFEWIRQLLDSHKSSEAEDFIKSLKVDLFEDEVFVFSPRGDLINLPAGSTPIDFAYSIHSAIGNKMTGAKISGKIVPLDYVLQNGDIVEIITSSTVNGPSRDWLKIAKTNTARKKIREWFKRENREENITRGKTQLERELRRAGLDPSTILKDKEWQQAAMRKYNTNGVDDIYAMIGYGGISVPKILTRLKDLYGKPAKAIEIKAQRTDNTSESGIIVNGVEGCLVKISKCCNPVPGDDITGFITRGRGVSVHRSDCVNTLTMENNDRLIDVWWSDVVNSNFAVSIKIITSQSNILMAKLHETLSELKINTVAMDAKFDRDNQGILNITIEINGKVQLETAIKKIWRIPGVTSVNRNTQ